MLKIYAFDSLMNDFCMCRYELLHISCLGLRETLMIVDLNSLIMIITIKRLVEWHVYIHRLSK